MMNSHNLRGYATSRGLCHFCHSWKFCTNQRYFFQPGSCVYICTRYQVSLKGFWDCQIIKIINKYSTFWWWQNVHQCQQFLSYFFLVSIKTPYSFYRSIRYTFRYLNSTHFIFPRSFKTFSLRYNKPWFFFEIMKKCTKQTKKSKIVYVRSQPRETLSWL